jgi:hypothetical protein
MSSSAVILFPFLPMIVATALVASAVEATRKRRSLERKVYSQQYQNRSYQNEKKINQIELYNEKKNALNKSLSKTISEIQNQCSYYSQEWKNIHELTEILQEKQKEILRGFTFDVYQSSPEWLNKKIQEFDETAISIRTFIQLLQLEQKEELSISSFENLLKELPKECNKIKKEIQEKVLKLIDKKIQKFVASNNLQGLENFYKEIPDSFVEVRNKIANVLLKHQLATQKKKSEEDDFLQKIQQLKSEAEKYYQKILQIHQSEANQIKENYDELKESDDFTRISYITRDIKIRYARIKRQYIKSEALKEDIKANFLDFPIPEVQMAVEEFLKKEFVSKQEYDDLIQSIENIILKKEEERIIQELRVNIISLIHEKLRDLGYSVIDDQIMEKLYNGEIVEIKTPYGEDYVVRIKIENNQLMMRFVRYVEDENQLSTYEKEKDIATAKKWCSSFDQILKHLKDNGILIEQKFRVEPEEKFYYEKKKNSTNVKSKHKNQKFTKKNYEVIL